MYTNDPSGHFYSLQYESSTYWKVGRGKLSYGNHYMCSGEATSIYYFNTLGFFMIFIGFPIFDIKLYTFSSKYSKSAYKVEYA